MWTSSNASRSNPWLSLPRQNPAAAVRLFCFPYSGATASLFYPWLDIVPAFIEVVPIQYPGRGSRIAEPLFTRLSPLVEQAGEALYPFLDRPFAFFGHSMGALVSFELCRYLRKRYQLNPIYLFVSGHIAPHLPDPEPPIHDLPEAEFIEKLRSLNGTPEEVLDNAELLELLLPILRADFTVCETYAYQPEEPLNCPICACGGVEDRYVSREGLAAWQAHTTASAIVRLFPGDHFYLNVARHHLLSVISRELMQAVQKIG